MTTRVGALQSTMLGAPLTEVDTFIKLLRPLEKFLEALEVKVSQKNTAFSRLERLMRLGNLSGFLKNHH